MPPFRTPLAVALVCGLAACSGGDPPQAQLGAGAQAVPAAEQAGATNRLNQLSDLLRQNPSATIEIEGYTDVTGSSQTNLRLSEERARAARSSAEARPAVALRSGAAAG